MHSKYLHMEICGAHCWVLRIKKNKIKRCSPNSGRLKIHGGDGSELVHTKSKQQWSKAHIESEMGGSDSNTEEVECCLPLGIVFWAVPLKGACVN